MTQIENPSPIIFFDGVCALCNGFVDFVLRQDKRRRFRFSPLQGERAKALLTPAQREDLTTVILYDSGRILSQSDAVLEILGKMGGTWKLAAAFKALPKPFRDWVYSQIARNRYRWFGKRDTCRLPSPEERSRFLD